MPQHDELCRLPLLRTHFPAVNPLLSDTLTLETDPKARPPPFALICRYAGKLRFGSDLWRKCSLQVIRLCPLVTHQQCIPVGRHAILWYGGLVRCAKFLHILFRLSQFCFCRPFLSVKQKALCTNVSQYNHLQTTWIDGFFAAASARENGLRRVVEVPGGIDFTGTCNSDPAHMSSFDILGGLH